MVLVCGNVSSFSLPRVWVGISEHSLKYDTDSSRKRLLFPALMEVGRKHLFHRRCYNYNALVGRINWKSNVDGQSLQVVYSRSTSFTSWWVQMGINIVTSVPTEADHRTVTSMAWKTLLQYICIWLLDKGKRMERFSLASKLPQMKKVLLFTEAIHGHGHSDVAITPNSVSSSD